jgi:hypothetical protein
MKPEIEYLNDQEVLFYYNGKIYFVTKPIYFHVWEIFHRGKSIVKCDNFETVIHYISGLKDKVRAKRKKR